jgi:hypothetical protein
VAGRALEQARHRLLGAPHVHLHVGIEVMGHRQIGIDFERATEGLFGLGVERSGSI